MLSGLLHPTAGAVEVLGHVPWRREREFLRQITLVMGNRNQLGWDIPALDSFELNRAIYRIPADEYRATLDELVELLDLTALLSKPVRKLSLGERMKCEVAAALLHRPAGAVPGRADDRPRRDHAAPHPRTSSPSTTGATGRPCC